MYENIVENWKLLSNDEEREKLAEYSEIGRLLTIGYCCTYYKVNVHKTIIVNNRGIYIYNKIIHHALQFHCNECNNSRNYKIIVLIKEKTIF